MVRIGVTLGDPAGIGPEIVEKALAAGAGEGADITVFGDARDGEPGKPTMESARAQVAYVEAAVEAAKRGELDGIVTAPISKTQAQAAGFAFPGHTEFFAARFEAKEHAMLFVGPRLRVVLATIHVALRDVADRLTSSDVAKAIVLGARALTRDLGIGGPRVGVVGLNPHAGEKGLFGTEEQTIIRPGMEEAARRLAAERIAARLAGPLVPDAAFREGADGKYDLLVAMYHDQGLIPVKLVDFDEAVNVTLGLPIVRTSPDHGVAYDVAGKGIARWTSMAAALRLAVRMCRTRATVA
jgi:4-hydroxythreonine-4-phosphate dehydrogenase